jgi:hypothetical protein
MTPHVLEVVVLEHDIPEQGLRRGDLGTVVEILQTMRSPWSSSQLQDERRHC